MNVNWFPSPAWFIARIICGGRRRRRGPTAAQSWKRSPRWLKWTFVGLTAVTSVGSAVAVAQNREVNPHHAAAIVYQGVEQEAEAAHEAATHDPAYRAAHEGWPAVCPTLTPAETADWKHWCDTFG